MTWLADSQSVGSPCRLPLIHLNARVPVPDRAGPIPKFVRLQRTKHRKLSQFESDLILYGRIRVQSHGNRKRERGGPGADAWLGGRGESLPDDREKCRA